MVIGDGSSRCRCTIGISVAGQPPTHELVRVHRLRLRLHLHRFQFVKLVGCQQH